MRKLKLAMYVSLDGVVENPGWTGPFWDDELSRLVLQQRRDLRSDRVSPISERDEWCCIEDQGHEPAGVREHAVVRSSRSRRSGLRRLLRRDRRVTHPLNG